jgi:putative chitinase
VDILTFQKAAGISSSTAAKWFEPISAACALYAIDTPARLAAFIAQVTHETVGLAFTREIWGPTAQQLKYEPPSDVAKDLGNTQPGDGKRFMGRGLIMYTGRANYQHLSDGLGFDYVTYPEQLEQVSDAAESGAFYWMDHDLNQYADNGDFVTLTRRINGGTTGLTDRQVRWVRAKIAFGIN